jgi:hypothetical protein
MDPKAGLDAFVKKQFFAAAGNHFVLFSVIQTSSLY